jgi:hypothetical protein
MLVSMRLTSLDQPCSSGSRRPATWGQRLADSTMPSIPAPGARESDANTAGPMPGVCPRHVQAAPEAQQARLLRLHEARTSINTSMPTATSNARAGRVQHRLDPSGKLLFRSCRTPATRAPGGDRAAAPAAHRQRAPTTAFSGTAQVPWQVWLDGLYAGRALLRRVRGAFGQSLFRRYPASSVGAATLRDTDTGLLCPAGTSRVRAGRIRPVLTRFWTRSLGWY